MKTRNEIIDYVKSELETGCGVVLATLGNGGAGLTIMQTQDDEEIACFISDLEASDFDGRVFCASDIADSEYYTEDCEVYQFDGNELRIQVVVYNN